MVGHLRYASTERDHIHQRCEHNGTKKLRRSKTPVRLSFLVAPTAPLASVPFCLAAARPVSPRSPWQRGSDSPRPHTSERGVTWALASKPVTPSLVLDAAEEGKELVDPAPSRSPSRAFSGGGGSPGSPSSRSAAGALGCRTHHAGTLATVFSFAACGAI